MCLHGSTRVASYSGLTWLESNLQTTTPLDSYKPRAFFVSATTIHRGGLIFRADLVEVNRPHHPPFSPLTPNKPTPLACVYVYVWCIAGVGSSSGPTWLVLPRLWPSWTSWQHSSGPQGWQGSLSPVTTSGRQQPAAASSARGRLLLQPQSCEGWGGAKDSAGRGADCCSCLEAVRAGEV